MLISHPLIADAAVVASPDEEVGEVPKAYLVLTGNEPVDKEDTAREVMAFVAGQVVHYKRVRRCEFVEVIPRTSSGKILRRELIERERLLGARARERQQSPAVEVPKDNRGRA